MNSSTKKNVKQRLAHFFLVMNSSTKKKCNQILLKLLQKT
eukprot:UN13663